MKYVAIFIFACVFVSPAMSRNTDPGKTIILNSGITADKPLLLFQGPGTYGITAVEFKAQQYCRAEPIEDFEFDVKFIVVSADVYFSGANFTDPVKSAITSNRLDPIRKFMDRSKPGTIVTFDNIKVKGPDNIVRTIEGVTYLLR